MSGLVDHSADARSKTIGLNFRVRASGAVDTESGTAYGLQNLSHSASSSVHTWTFSTAAPDANYTVVVGPFRSGGYNEVTTVTSKAAGSFTCTQHTVSGGLSDKGQNVAVFY